MEFIVFVFFLVVLALLGVWAFAWVVGGIVGWVLAPLAQKEPEAEIQVQVEVSEEEPEAESDRDS